MEKVKQTMLMHLRGLSALIYHARAFRSCGWLLRTLIFLLAAKYNRISSEEADAACGEKGLTEGTVLLSAFVL